MEDQKVKQLAETLLKQGFAASMYDAIEKAKSIIGDEAKKEPEDSSEPDKGTDEILDSAGVQPEPAKQEPAAEAPAPANTPNPDNPDYDISKQGNVTVNELMKELGVNPEEVEEKEKQHLMEEAHDIKQDIQEAEKENSEKKIEQIKEKVEEFKHDIDEFESEK